MPHLDPAWIALIGTLCGGLGLKLLEHWLGKNKVRVDEASKLRDELRLEIAAQREEIKALEGEVNKWRTDYLDLRDKFMELRLEHIMALEKIKAEALEAQKKIDKTIDPPGVP